MSRKLSVKNSKLKRNITILERKNTKHIIREEKEKSEKLKSSNNIDAKFNKHLRFHSKEQKRRKPKRNQEE
jgi:hypothetical protein